MATVFLKKRIENVAGLVAFFIISFSFIFAYVLQNATSVAHLKSFYFLVSSSTHVEAGAYEVTQKGGAGYLLQSGERAFVAYAVYFTQAEGERAQKNLKEKDVCIVKKTAGNLYFKTRKEKRNEQKIVNAFSCLQDCMEVLEREINRLSEGATQESSRRILRILQKQFIYLQAQYKGAFPDFIAVCKQTAEDLEEIIVGTIYLKDLRRVLCALCDGYVRLAGNFVL